ncbi:MAG: hypothetical protein ACRDQA_02515 [Nocardioidaceae bacterium]
MGHPPRRRHGTGPVAAIGAPIKAKEKNMTDGPETATFCLNVALPFTVPQPNCCTGYDVEIHMDYDARGKDDHIVAFTHETDCEVWRYLP